jgi:hypothetical protein
MQPITTMPRTLLCADPAVMIRTLRTMIAQQEQDVARMRKELADLLEASGRRPGDGSDQPGLFEAARQPKLW